MDSPYRPASRWGFQLDAGFGCTDGVSYDAADPLTILAVKGDDGMAGMAL